MPERTLHIQDPVKVVDDGDEFDGKTGIIRDFGKRNDYFVSFPDKPGYYPFDEDSLILNITSNILEIVMESSMDLPDDVHRALYGVTELNTVEGTYFNILRYSFQQRLPKEINTMLISAHKNDEIIAFKAEFYA